MFKRATLFTALLLAACVLGSSVKPAMEMSTNVRQASPSGLGACGAEITMRKILPLATCVCQVLFTGELQVNIGDRIQSDCLGIFGSVEAILAIQDACFNFRKENGSLKKRNIERRLNWVAGVCFPDEDLIVIVF